MRTSALSTSAVKSSLPYWLDVIDAFAAEHPAKVPELAEAAEFLRSGVHSELLSVPPAVRFKNTPAVARERVFVQERIDYYRDLGALAAIGQEDEFDRLQPLHVIIKDGRKPRLVLDLSRNLNDHLPRYKIRYEGIDHALSNCTPGCWFGKTDFADCFLAFDVKPEFREHLRFAFEGQAYEFKRMPFGLSTAPRLCELLLSIVSFDLRRRGIKHSRYVDDVLYFAETKDGLEQALATALDVYSAFGLPVGHHKTVHATQEITFLGVLFDSRAKTLALTPERKAEIVALCRSFLSRSTCKAQHVMSLAGKFNFAAQVLPGARPFLRRIIDSFRGRHRNEWLTVSNSFRCDLRSWLRYLSTWNGRQAWRDDRRVFEFRSDASLEGFGFYLSAGGTASSRIAFAGTWSTGHQRYLSHHHIGLLEALAALHAVAAYGPILRDSVVKLLIDNQGDVAIINRQSTRSPAILTVLRALYELATKYNFSIVAEHIPGIDNIVADALSRPGSQPLPHATQRSAFAVRDVCSCQLALPELDRETRRWQRLCTYSARCTCAPAPAEPTAPASASSSPSAARSASTAPLRSPRTPSARPRWTSAAPARSPHFLSTSPPSRSSTPTRATDLSRATSPTARPAAASSTSSARWTRSSPSTRSPSRTSAASSTSSTSTASRTPPSGRR